MLIASGIIGRHAITKYSYDYARLNEILAFVNLLFFSTMYGVIKPSIDRGRRYFVALYSHNYEQPLVSRIVQSSTMLYYLYFFTFSMIGLNMYSSSIIFVNLYRFKKSHNRSL